MSLFRTLSRPRSHTAGSKTIAAYTSMTRDYIPVLHNGYDDRRGRLTETEKRRLGQTNSFEDVFIKSLVAAGRCSEHRRLQWQGERRSVRERCFAATQRPALGHAPRRDLSTSSRRTQTAVAFAREEDEQEPLISKDEYKDVVNTYGLPSDMWNEPLPSKRSQKKARDKLKHDAPLAPRLVTPPDKEDKPLYKVHFPLAPRLAISPGKEDKPPYGARQVLPPEDEEHARDLQHFRRMLKREPGTSQQDSLWQAFENLRRPRVRYLADREIRTTFNHLTWNEFAHTPNASQRYFTLLDECIREEVHLTVVEWSAGINFTGRQVRHGTSEDVKNAIELWMKMEDSGIQANNVTFNILFYTAVRAGRFALADTIYGELKARGMELDRYFHCSNIYYAGMRGNGDAVRRAFNDLVNASEIVDVGVMNCVILSLIRAGEAAAAEHVFGKMKALHETKFGTKGPEHWREQRKLFQLLNKTGKALRKQKKEHISSFFGTAFSGDDRKEQIQKAAPIAPDPQTYRLLLRYHARVSGNMDRVQELLAESKACGFHTHGSVYFSIFCGFHAHGGYSYTAWSPRMLESFWQEFLAASSSPNADGSLSAGPEHISTPSSTDPSAEEEDFDYLAQFSGPDGLEEMEEEGLADDEEYLSEESRPPYFTQSMAIVVLRAYYKCCGKKRMLAVWAEIKVRWKECGPVDRETVEGMIGEMCRWDL